MVEDALKNFDKIVEEKRKAIDEEIVKIIENVRSRRRSEILRIKDKALKQIMQLLKSGT
ncbi:MAG TPA: hypothetical protein VNL13_02365 [Sulfolobales archaeon]|nr:hypothetical protein [Sulfolobales archaeon]